MIGTPNAAEIPLNRGPADVALQALHQPYHRHILTEAVLKEIGTRAHLQPIKTYLRMDFDTLWPGVNAQFMLSYVKARGNWLDVIVEKPKLGLVLASPTLLLKFFAGYFLRHPGQMSVIFRKQAQDTC